MSVFLRAGELLLRGWETRDASGLSLIGDDEDIEKNMNDGFPRPFSPERADEFIRRARQSRDLFLAIEGKGGIVGSIGAFFDATDASRVVIAYFIGKQYWNRGYASAAIKALVEYLVGERGIERITAAPFERNSGSRRALEKNGFRLLETRIDGASKGGVRLNTCAYEYRKP